MQSNKNDLIGSITIFLNGINNNNIYKFSKNGLSYFASKNFYTENEFKLIIVPSDWIRGKKIKKWLNNYLVLTNDFKLISVSTNDLVVSSNDEKTDLNLQIMDFTLEDKRVFNKHIFQTNSIEYQNFTYENQLERESSVSETKKNNRRNMHMIKLQKEVFKTESSVKICVISPFTYGKSALINSLLGQSILAEDILVKTAKITKINHNSHNWLMKEGKQHFIEQYTDINNFRSRLNYLTTINEKSNHVIRATIDSEILKNITLVDTPGLFGKFSHHDEITENIIEDVDHIIYVLSPTQLGFEPYTRKINEWQKKYNKRCTFVMNKVDLVKEDIDRQNLKQEFQKKIGQFISYDGLFLVSAYGALKSRMFKNNTLDLLSLKKDILISVNKNGEIYSGRLFTEECVEILEKESGILELEAYLNKMYGE